jgi:hypothetical protein
VEIPLGFGGVGASGMGRYSGYDGFKAWCNQKAIVEKWQTNIWPFNWIAPPYTDNKKSFIRILMSLLWIKQKQAFFKIIEIIAFLFVIYLFFSNFFGLGYKGIIKLAIEYLIYVLKNIDS